jgi:hypothetical protein
VAAQACELIAEFYLLQGNEELAETFNNRAVEYYVKALKLNHEATNFSAKDQFVPHNLDQTRLQKLQTQLQTIRGLRAAFLIRKIVEGAEPVDVLAVMAAFTWKDGQNGLHIDQLFEDLSANVDLPSPLVVLSLDGEHGDLIAPISSVPGAQVFATPGTVVTTYRG